MKNEKLRCKCGNFIFVVTKVKDAGKNIVANLKCLKCGNRIIFKKSDVGKEIKLIKVNKNGNWK